jgi:hypothetical protein
VAFQRKKPAAIGVKAPYLGIFAPDVPECFQADAVNDNWEP